MKLIGAWPQHLEPFFPLLRVLLEAVLEARDEVHVGLYDAVSASRSWHDITHIYKFGCNEISISLMY